MSNSEGFFMLVFFINHILCQDFQYSMLHRNHSNKITKTKIKDVDRNLSFFIAHANNPFGNSMLLTKKINQLNNSNYFQNNYKIQSAPIFETASIDQSQQLNHSKDITNNDPELRSKRAVIHLYNMVNCATGCNPLKYKGYGCFCGFLGSGHPVDGIDRCCKQHDWCYDAAGCPMFFEYIVPYYWKCYHNRPICAIHHGDLGGPGSCAYKLCQCDKVLSECLSKYPCPSSRALCLSSPLRLLQNKFMIFP